MSDLDYLRERIDAIDEGLVKLLFERMDVVEKVAEYKAKHSMKVLDEAREEKIKKKFMDKVVSEDKKLLLSEFLEALMSISKNSQQAKLKQNNVFALKNDVTTSCKIGFQGVAGSFSHEAVLEYFGEDLEANCYLNFKDVFDAIDKDEIQYGVLPIENSSTGGVAEVYDLLGKYSFHIIGEKCIKVNHNLLGIKGSEISSIQEVYSHSQGFLQCSDFFEYNDHWKLIPYFNTAKSAQYISTINSNSKACVASKKAAKIYGLDILKQNINNSKNNYTKFIIISKVMEINKQCDKISVVISLPHKVGSLYSVLKHFAINNANLLKIESRPIPDNSWKYLFYIDFNGNLLKQKSKDILNNIKAESLYYKLLGNYKSE